MRRVGVSTGSFYDLGLMTEETIYKLGDLKVNLVELFIQTPSEMSPTYIFQLRKQLKEVGIEVNSLHPFIPGYEVPSLFSEYTRQYEDALSKFHRYLEICNMLGTKNFVTHGPIKKLNLSERNISLYFKRLNEMLKISSEYKVDICIENTDYNFFDNPESILKNSQMIIEPNFKYVLDFKSAWKSGFKPEDFTSVMNGRLAFTHASYKDEKRGLFGGNYFKKDEDIITTIKSLDGYSESMVHIMEVFWSNSIDQIKESVNFLKNI